ncbi:MAG: hypothetical protein SFT94_12325 [Pseudanabaenaceae cyanobacterium bins.68]|nr:hypothetical protein [Pseudanabaenaceae cyanobacterium bins.68]
MKNQRMKTQLVGWLCLLAFTGLEAIAAEVSLNPGFKTDPLKLAGVAGGRVNMAQLSGGVSGKCRGFAQEQPNFVLNLSQNLMLDLLVYSPELNSDTTMLIKGENGLVICADDEYQARHPQLTRRRFGRGVYQVWVGSGDPQKSVNFTLSLSEFGQK